MDIKDTAQFKSQLDKILKDTEEFVNASQQLNEAKKSLDDFIHEFGQISDNIARAAKLEAELAENYKKVFEGDFLNSAKTLMGEIEDIILKCEEKAELLGSLYNDAMRNDKITEMNERITSIEGRQKLILDKLDKILEENQSSN